MLVHIIILLLSCSIDQGFSLQEGDLLFQDSDCGPFCESIEKVTFGYKGAKLSHVGIVVKGDDKNLKVIEAITKGVVYTSLEEFLSRSYDKNGNSKVIVGRMKPEHQHFIPTALSYATSKIGKKYDDIFEIDNDTYYCSELIYESFRFANNGKDVFKLYPMTFMDPDTKKTFDIWNTYYENLGKDIPEGKLGLNPGGMSKSSFLNIVHMYGVPQGMN